MGEYDRLIALLPQKPPFLFVDEILEHEPLRLARGAQTFPSDHPVFENHLPGDPIVPGVILVEALAQISGVVLLARDAASAVRGYLAGMDLVRFRRLVRPGERVLLDAQLDRRFGTAATFLVRATVGGELAAEGRLSIGGVEAAFVARAQGD